jgi:hypothetical protein
MNSKTVLSTFCKQLHMSKNHTIILIILMCCSLNMLAQNKDGDVKIPDTLDFAYVEITGVVITGNKLTKERIIIRELDFKIGDSLSAFTKGSPADLSERRTPGKDSSELRSRLKYSRENIINTKLFLTVNMWLVKIAGNEYRLHIDVSERHYWWLFPIPKLNAPNFNEWIRDPDLSDISMGLFFSHNNLFGLNHQTSVLAMVGKSWGVAFGYKIPWIGKGQKIGLLLTTAYANAYTAEYASVDNERQMIYATSSLQTVKAGAKLTLRPGLYNYGTILIRGEYVKISDTMHTLNSSFLGGDKKSNVSLSIYADYYRDTRNCKNYPLKGNLLKVFINKVGIGLLSKDVNLFYYGLDFHFHQTIGKRWYLAEMIKAENSSGENAPYYYQLNLTGDKNFIRGFDLFTIKGDQIYYTRNNIKFEMVKPGVRKVKPGVKMAKFKALPYAFYLNAFGDAGYVVNKFTDVNPNNNKFLFSGGLGLDFVTYYDLVLRFEYAFTSVKTNGFFIAFGMPI